MLTEDCNHNVEGDTTRLFGKECERCGLTITFADDASILLKCKRGEDRIISNMLDSIFSKLEVFLKANCLQLNVNKTQLLRVTPRQQLAANGGQGIGLQALDVKRIMPKSSAKILGLIV